MPEWLAAHIRDSTGQEPGGRYARRSTCRVCKALVLRGVDSEWAGIVVAVDPAPVTAAGEWLARRAGRGSYALRRRLGGRLELTCRDHWQIRGRPAGAGTTVGPFGFVVVVEHACAEQEGR